MVCLELHLGMKENRDEANNGLLRTSLSRRRRGRTLEASMTRSGILLAVALMFTSCATIEPESTLEPTSQQIRWFESNSMITGLSRAAIKSMKVHDNIQDGQGVFRVVMDLTQKDFRNLTWYHPFFERWIESKIPTGLWKGSVALGEDPEPEEVFLPSYDARLWWIYIAPPEDYAPVPRRLYVIQFAEDNKSWKLYYIYVDY